ncbi:MAG: response regulator [Gammaproteobacteria bacterium]|nr:response regulator [Gammaproteobacteria bacterium]
MPSDVTVYIVDDDAGVRHSLSLLIQSVKLKTESYESAQQFLEHYDSSRPGCLVLDIRMPEMSGMELLEKFTENNIHIPVIVVTGHGDTTLAVRAMKAGVIDFIEKPFNDQVLLDAISAGIARSTEMFNAQVDCERYAAMVRKLSSREAEVMDLMVKGKGAKEIGVLLGISSKTVDVHRGHILEKMQVKSVSELVRLVVMHSEHPFSCEQLSN